MKKLLSAVLAIMVLACLSVPVLASDSADVGTVAPAVVTGDNSEPITKLVPVEGPGARSVSYQLTANTNLRKTAGLSGTIITTLPKGTIVSASNLNTVSKDGYQWANVQSATYGWGYIAVDYAEVIG